MTDVTPPAPAAPPAAAPASVAPANPGKTMGITALALSIIGLHVFGIIFGFVGLNQSKKAGQKNGLALAGIIIGFVSLIAVIALVASGNALVAGLLAMFNGA